MNRLQIGVRWVKRQISYDLKISSHTPKEKLEHSIKQIRTYVENHPGIHPETIFVNFTRYETDSLNIMLYFFTKTTDWGEFLAIQEEINSKSLKSSAKKTSKLPFLRNLYVWKKKAL